MASFVAIPASTVRIGGIPNHNREEPASSPPGPLSLPMQPGESSPPLGQLPPPPQLGLLPSTLPPAGSPLPLPMMPGEIISTVGSTPINSAASGITPHTTYAAWGIISTVGSTPINSAASGITPHTTYAAWGIISTVGSTPINSAASVITAPTTYAAGGSSPPMGLHPSILPPAGSPLLLGLPPLTPLPRGPSSPQPRLPRRQMSSHSLNLAPPLRRVNLQNRVPDPHQMDTLSWTAIEYCFVAGLEFNAILAQVQHPNNVSSRVQLLSLLLSISLYLLIAANWIFARTHPKMAYVMDRVGSAIVLISSTIAAMPTIPEYVSIVCAILMIIVYAYNRFSS